MYSIISTPYSKRGFPTAHVISFFKVINVYSQGINPSRHIYICLVITGETVAHLTDSYQEVCMCTEVCVRKCLPSDPLKQENI